MIERTYAVLTTTEVKSQYKIGAKSEKEAKRIANDIQSNRLSTAKLENDIAFTRKTITKVISTEKFCPVCGKSFQNMTQGKTAIYCTSACRDTDYRSRKIPLTNRG